MEADDVHTWGDVKDRLDRLPRGAAYQLAGQLKMNSSLLYRKLKAAKGELNVRQAKTIGEFLSQAETGEGPPMVAEPSREFSHASPQRALPVYGYAAGSDGELIAFNDGQVLEWLVLPHGIELGDGEYFVVRKIGSSMEPRIFAGDNMVARRAYPPARGKDVVIEFRDGSALVKTFEGQRDGRVYAKQWNEEKLLDFDASTIRALHAVTFKL